MIIPSEALHVCLYFGNELNRSKKFLWKCCLSGSFPVKFSKKVVWKIAQITGWDNHR